MSVSTTSRNDLHIQEDVLVELNWDPRFTPAEVGVEVDGGVVTLQGTVSSYPKLRVAAELASRVPGVRAVVNALEVRPPDAIDDLALATRARLALELDADVPNERIECFVRDGVLTLRGSVDHAYQRRAAEAAVARLEHLRGVDIEIDVRGHLRSDAEIHRDLHDALHRRVPGAKGIDLNVNAGTVTLSGRVPTLAERTEAEETAWGSRGVRHVIDRVVVMGGA